MIVGLTPNGDPLKDKLYTMLNNFGYTTYNYSSETEMETYIRNTAYQNSTQVCFGITVQNSTAGNYQYKLRFNVSEDGSGDGPSTQSSLTEDAGVDLDKYNTVLYKGMLGANILVDTAILQLQTGNNNDYFQANVSPVYQENYILDKIYIDLGSNIGMIILLPLLIIYLRQTSSMLTEKEVLLHLFRPKCAKACTSWG